MNYAKRALRRDDLVSRIVVAGLGLLLSVLILSCVAFVLFVAFSFASAFTILTLLAVMILIPLAIVRDVMGSAPGSAPD